MKKIKLCYIFGIFALIFAYIAVIFVGFNPQGDPFSKRYSEATFDREGKILSAFLNEKEQWHLKSTTPLPDKLKIAITFFEDKRFYSHFGVDFRAIVRSFWRNLNSKKRSGASTITMQTIKLLRGDSRTYFNKFREIIFALKLESIYSKDEILEFYANNAPYGGNIVGVQTAALMYFAKDLSQISWGEAALLAVLPNSPGAMHLQKNPQQLLNKRNALLEKLHSKGIIDDDNLKLATNEPLPRLKRTKNIAPHLSLRLINSQNLPDSTPNIHTTIDKPLQMRLESILKNHHQKLFTLGIQNVAAIIVDTHSREVVAYSGSQDFFDIEGLGQIDGVVAKRSVGSVLKPLLYALAIDRGLIAPQSKLIDAPTIWGNFKPNNANKQHYGFVSAQNALIRSLNVPFVALLQDYGYERFFFDLQNILGFEDGDFERYGLSLILGTKEFSVEDVAKIYAGLGNYGEFGDLKYLRDFAKDSADSATDSTLDSAKKSTLDSAESATDSTLDSTESATDSTLDSTLNSIKSPHKRQFISQGASFLTLDALRRLERFGIENFYKNQKIFSWKSGTSYGRKDAWAAGTSPKYTIVVWAGNFDGSANPNLFGVNIAGDLLFEILGIWRDLGAFEMPQGALKRIKVDALTGYDWDYDDVKFAEILYPNNALPLRKSPFLKRIFVDKNGAEVSSKSGDFLHAHAKSALNLPINLIDFLAHRTKMKTKSPNVKILYPKEGIKIRLTRDFRGENVLILRIANVENRNVFWYLDGEFIGEGVEKSRAILAESGGHTISVIDENGEGDSVRFIVE